MGALPANKGNSLGYKLFFKRLILELALNLPARNPGRLALLSRRVQSEPACGRCGRDYRSLEIICYLVLVPYLN